MQALYFYGTADQKCVNYQVNSIAYTSALLRCSLE